MDQDPRGHLVGTSQARAAHNQPMPHDPTVTAAVITVAGTGFVAVTGYLATRSSTKRAIDAGERTSKATLASADGNVQAAIRGEREHRLWERRTDIYNQIIAIVLYQRDVRRKLVGKVRFDQATEKAEVNEINSFVPHLSAYELEARVWAYGSTEVIAAFTAVADAHRAFMGKVQALNEAAPGVERLAALGDRDAAATTAQEKETALIDMVRAGIQEIR